MMGQLTFRWRDLVSFEMVFVLYLYAGTFKQSEFLRPVNEAFDLTLAMLLLGVAVGALLVLRGIRWPGGSANTYLAVFVLFLLYASVSYLLTDRHSQDARRKFQEFVVLDTWAVLAPLIIINTPARIRRFLRVLFWFLALVSMDSVLRGGILAQQGQRWVGAFGGEGYQWLGMVAATGIILLFTAVVTSWKTGKTWVRILTASIFGGVLVWVMFIAGAQQALLALLAALAFLVYRTGVVRPQLGRLFLYAIAASLIVGTFFVLRTYVLPETLAVARGMSELLFFLDVGVVEALERTNRPLLWADGLRVWLEHPLFGAGFASFSEASTYETWRHPHNLFLEALSELGLTGFVLVAGMVFLPLRAIVRKGAEFVEPTFLMLGAVWVAVLSAAMVGGDITDNRVLLAYGALVLVSASHMRYSNRAGGGIGNGAAVATEGSIA